jgi:CBS domain containing-hemolysin-like protein
MDNQSASSSVRLKRYYQELVALERRKSIINIATAFLVLSAVLIAMTVIELFFSVSVEPGKLSLSNWVAITFVSSFISLVTACILYFAEILYASNTITFHPIAHDKVH